jgi:UPF0755 protein
MNDEHDPDAGYPDDSGILPRVDDHDDHYDEAPVYVAGGSRRAEKKRRGGVGCLVALVALAVVAGLLYVGVTTGLDKIRDQFADPEDYAGPGSGEVTFEVVQGDSIADMGRNLKAAGIVASVEAFTTAAGSNPEATTIQAGFFPLQEQMRAADVVDVLVDPSNIVTTSVTVPEGLRAVDIVAALAEGTDFPAKAFTKILADPAQLAELGLPDYAAGNPEGYLFPATYAFGPNDKPADMIRQMLARWAQSAEAADLEGAATRLGYTPAELMTIASLVQAEGRGDDMGKIARVIYNRLEGDETNGLLQIDASVNYGLQQDLGVALTTEQLEEDTPYNTYTRTGLPPTPIEAPGDAAIAAATTPADGPWFYYVTVDLATGETKFAEDYDEFLGYKAEFQQYCETSDAC